VTPVSGLPSAILAGSDSGASEHAAIAELPRRAGWPADRQADSFLAFGVVADRRAADGADGVAAC